MITDTLVVLFGINLLLLSFNAGVLWNKVTTLSRDMSKVQANLHELNESFNYLSGQLFITHQLKKKDVNE